MNILVTGAAGFIGFHLSKRLLEEGHSVIGVDNLNNYYSPRLKNERISYLEKYGESFQFYKLDISDRNALSNVFLKYRFDVVYHLAAQAGVRHSINHPDVYIQSNLIGFYNIIEEARKTKLKHLIFASSSSVYGANQKIPYSVNDITDHPVSLYAATKKSNEMLAHSYSHLYNIPMTGLRFFTVYGPWGRPDMAYFKFTDLITRGKEIEIYNNGDMYRDFTYIDDIVEALYRLLNHAPSVDADNLPSPYQLFNIGNNSPVKLLDFINVLEDELGIKAKKIFKPMQPGDVYRTWADCTSLYQKINYTPCTPLKIGIQKFVLWYNKNYSSLYNYQQKLSG